MVNAYHIPVLRDACLDGLALRPGGTYVDATFGGGGHSRALLERMEGGRLIAFDRDADAQGNLPDDPRLTLVHHDYRFMQQYLDYLGVIPVDGILADLGISSHQIDEGERGFSFRFDAPLDMRMDRQTPITAAHLLNDTPVDDLQQLFSEYGEIRNARTLARAIGTRRTHSRILTTGQLMAIGEEVLPARENLKKYMAPVFQALRIAVNDELNGLKEFLEASLRVLRPGGRLVVLTYHSLEDRLVKNFIQDGGFEGAVQTDLVFGRKQSAWEQVTRKPIVPDEEEIQQNPRARSAKLRIAEKTKEEEGR